MEFIITFGMGWTLRNNFVRIQAADEAAARKIAFETYGSAWAFLYENEEEAGVDRFKLTEVPFGTENHRQ